MPERGQAVFEFVLMLVFITAVSLALTGLVRALACQGIWMCEAVSVNVP